MVKINFKTVQNKLFSVEAEESETVGDVKKRIQESQSFPAENQKLIYSGKILNDTATVGTLNIKEKDFLVVMVSKPKAQPTPAPAPAASSSTPAAPAQEASAATSTPAAATVTAETSASTDAPASSEAPATESASTGFGGGSFISGPALQSAISSMTEMGFERDQVMRAMKASFNNPDRAVEYLMSGNIPEVEQSRPAPPPVAQPGVAAGGAAGGPPAPVAPAPASAPAAPSGGDASENLFAAAEAAMNRDRGTAAGGAGGAGAGLGGGDGLGGAAAALANSPQIQQLRQMVQQNPALIQPLLQQIASSNPQLAQLINQNPQAIYDLLGVAPDGEGEGDDDEFLGPQTMQINLTEDEAAAVERLEGLGFDRQMVLQAYMLCDKNEELAANFLFDSGEDDQP